MPRSIALASALVFTAACTGIPSTPPEPDPVLGHCIYINVFSERRGV